MQLIIDNISKSYNGKYVLQNFNTTLDAGHSYLLVGKNGAGKSTLFNILAGNIPSDSGSFNLSNSDNSSKNINDDLVVQYQSFNSFEKLKVKEVIDLFKSFTNNYNFDMALYNILEIEKTKNKLVGVLSGGEKKALSLFITFLLNKSIIFLDEPFNELDAEKKLKITKHLTNLPKKDKILVFVSHEVNDFMDIFTDIIVIKDGKALLNMPKNKVLQKYSHPLINGIAGIYYSLTGEIIAVA